MSKASLLHRITPFFVSRINQIPCFVRVKSSSASPSTLSEPSTSPSVPSALPDGSVYLTDNFVKRMKELQASESSDEKMLRLGVEAGGCSGFKYVFDFDSKFNPDDRLFEKEGVKLVVDDVTYGFVKGATVDYEEELIRSAFVVTSNPNSSSQCGCNSSFSVKP